MHEYWRTILYPLGFIASFFFGIRFILQWISSEKKRTSHVSSSFWMISFIANILMAVHTFIQVQYPFCVIQTCNAVLSWRNLQLMKDDPKDKLPQVLAWLLIAIAVPTTGFVIEGYIMYGVVDWVRTPTLPWSNTDGVPLPLPWHILGFIGASLFALRFWIQWWRAEKKKTSYLGFSFWWLSLIGATLALAYFIKLLDWVNIIGYSMGIVPYIRNLMLLNKSKALVSTPE